MAFREPISICSQILKSRSSKKFFLNVRNLQRCYVERSTYTECNAEPSPLEDGGTKHVLEYLFQDVLHVVRNINEKIYTEP